MLFSLLFIGCQSPLVGEAKKTRLIDTTENKPVEKIDLVVELDTRTKLTSSESRKLQSKISTSPGRITKVEEIVPQKRTGGRKPQGEEVIKPLTFSFLAVPPILDMKGMDYQPGAWEKITGTGVGVYRGVSVYTDPETKIVEEILAVAGLSSFGQLWKWDMLTNQGKWEQIIINNANFDIISAQINPSNKNHFIVALKEPKTSQKNKEVLNVYSSLDAGKTWTTILSLSPEIETSQGVTVRFFDGSHLILMHRTEGVFISSDSGKTWKNTKKSHLEHWSSEFSSVTAKGRAMIYFHQEKALYLTTDYGMNWKKVKDVSNDEVPSDDESKRVTMSYAWTDDILYVISTPVTSGIKKIYSSIDGGATWQMVTTTLPSYTGWPEQSVVVDPNNKDHLNIFLYMGGPFESFDGGKSWVRYYDINSGLKIDTVKEINCKSCGIPYDVRGTFSDGYNHIFYASDQGLFMIIPPSLKGDSPSLFNIGKPLSFEDSAAIQVDNCGNLYYSIWHRSPVIKTKEGYYYADSPEKWGVMLTDPSKCTDAPMLIVGTSNYFGISNYVQNFKSYDLSFTFKDFKSGFGNVVYFKNKLYAINNENKLQRLDIFAKTLSPTAVFSKEISYIFKSVGDGVLYVVDSSGIIWQTSDGENWAYDTFPLSVGKYNLRGGTASGNPYLLVSDSSFVGSVNPGDVRVWPNTEKIIHVLADKICQTRLYGIADAKDKSGIDINTIKVSLDFGQTWQEFGLGISGTVNIYFGDTDSKYLYVATSERGVWKRSTEGLECKKWIDIEQKYSTVKEVCDNDVDDDGNGLVDCADKVSCASDCSVVDIPDAALKVAIQNGLGDDNLEPKSEITIAEAKKLLKISVYDKKNIDLKGLEKFTNLEALQIVSTPISDVSALKGMTQLTTLWLINNQISDVSALKGMTQLATLELGANQISDVSALKGMTQLTTLQLKKNQISDVSALKGMTQLTSLYLADNQISDLSALKGMTQLTSLYLADNQISDLSALKGMTQLTKLHLHNNQISDLSALKGMTKLGYLSLWGNPLKGNCVDSDELNSKEKVNAFLDKCLGK